MPPTLNLWVPAMLEVSIFQVVLDTNVVAAAMLSRRGASHQVLRLVGDPRWRLNLSVPLALEYEQTLKRVCAGSEVGPDGIDGVLAYLRRAAHLRPIFFLWRPLLPDPGDHMVLELAVESRADFIVTFNANDFAPAGRFGIRVVTPAEFLAILEGKHDHHSDVAG